ncbi:hypothetical protein AMTR_s00002p00177430 [Amborella trichopoda]|uniref:ERCC4 domain-containing protein n=2 Tax=Amborella trichopoda TaxID=13333 RepID=W1P0J5_AMBTC|nr:hypothetical protein AMTR_s00002p00177430 [Amborella trichopoda]
MSTKHSLGYTVFSNLLGEGTPQPSLVDIWRMGELWISDVSNEAKDSHSSMVLEVVLEEPPKWKVLREVLEEVEEERQKQVLNEDTWDDESNTVLVACKDELSCMQLQDCISKGPQQVMREEWERYLLGKADLHGLKTRNKKKSQEPKGFGVLNGVIPARPGENAEASSISNLEQSALLAAAAEVKNVGEEEAVTREPQLHGGRGNRGRGRGRGRGSGGKTSGSKARLPKSKDKGKQEKGNSTLMSESGNEDRAAGEGPVAMASSFTKMGGGASVENGNIGTKPLPVVQFFAMDSDQKILDVFKPSVIIVYHPDMTFVREIEVYKAENPTRNLKVYFLFYEESTEVQKFEASIRRENGAFESLIRQKSLMMIPVDQDGRVVPNTPGEPQSLISQNALTRKAGGRKAIEKETQVIVDVREFMSSLPNVLHQKGMKIIPVTLEVGDYILSPLICVERKSIADLYSSFASGRLYNQVETMVRYYRIPVVLIEFSQDKSFSFQSASEIGDDVSPNSIISKLCLLVLHFPRLRLVWSRSLHATAEIFASLKANQDEPDESTAMRVGVPSEEGIVENDVRAENYNTSAVEFLRRLPGVTDSNYRSIMDGCNSLAELAVLPLEKLAELMGGQRAARMLRDFLDAKCPNF